MPNVLHDRSLHNTLHNIIAAVRLPLSKLACGATRKSAEAAPHRTISRLSFFSQNNRTGNDAQNAYVIIHYISCEATRLTSSQKKMYRL
jgi:hypothetical protein